MAEYDLTPIPIDDDVEGTHELLRRYFIRENNPFNVISDFVSEDGFTFDIMRSYSFIASEHRATLHLSGIPQEDGTTLVKVHAKSVETQENLEKEVRDRIAETMKHMVAEKKNRPVEEDPVDEEEAKRKNRIELIVMAAIAAVIIIGALPVSCSDQFSSLWIF